MKQIEVSRATMGRIPTYLRYLRDIEGETENISATMLARGLGLGEVQVRKDLASVSGAGRPKTGYRICELINALESFLGADGRTEAVLVGAGKLGRALLDYSGFGEYGLDIAAAFDAAVDETEKSDSGKPIYPMEQFCDFCRKNNVKIGVITVPAAQAQQVCDLLTENGIKAVWCFAPCTLSVPEDVSVQYENMALSLAYLKSKAGV